MGRKPRQNNPGATHHVYGRGVAGRTIFEDGVDRGVFYSLLEKQVALGRLVVYAFVLMSNHFHLLVMSPTGELDLAMRDLLRDYVLIFNPRHLRDGPLFKSRYGSKPVSSINYKRRVLAYIDRNPVAARMASQAIDYPHGSAYRFHHGTAPPWLNTSWVESLLEETRGIVGMPVGTYGTGGRGAFEAENDEFVEARMNSVGWIDPLDRALETPEQRDVFLRELFSTRSVDGTQRAHELPVAAATTVMRVCKKLQETSPPWLERTSRGACDLWEAAMSGLLIRMSGITGDAVGRTLRLGRAAVARRVATHQDRLVRDPGYEARIHEVAREVLWGGGSC